ncbi:MAG: HAMP domain-containing sensor histidine kinase [Candidatus Omnitrophota bacterium]
MIEIPNVTKEELIRKYKLAGKIRFISFSMLLLFLFAMKSIGGYPYLNGVFILLILVEAVLNQPYIFLINRVSVNRFQYYQMATDIIAISWIIYYMGGLEAPLVSIAYYVVILWAGVVSSAQAVFFASALSAISFALIAIFQHYGLIPFISYYGYKMPTIQMFSILLGNISFLFAFGYFSAHSSRVIQFIQRKRQEDTLRNVHKFLAAGYLINNIAHDILNHLASIRGYTRILLERIARGSLEREMLQSVERLEEESADLLSRLSRFSRKPNDDRTLMNIHDILADVIKLTSPIIKYSKLTIESSFCNDMPSFAMNKNQFQEVFMVFIMNALDAIVDKGALLIRTSFDKIGGFAKIAFTDDGRGMSREDLKRIGELFFTTKDPKSGSGLGLATAYWIIGRYKGKIKVESAPGKGTTFTIELPVDSDDSSPR